jgi:hypothetical protein
MHQTVRPLWSAFWQYNTLILFLVSVQCPSLLESLFQKLFLSTIRWTSDDGNRAISKFCCVHKYSYPENIKAFHIHYVQAVLWTLKKSIPGHHLYKMQYKNAIWTRSLGHRTHSEHQNSTRQRNLKTLFTICQYKSMSRKHSLISLSYRNTFWSTCYKHGYLWERCSYCIKPLYITVVPSCPHFAETWIM